MTAAELDAFLRDQLAQLEAARPGAARIPRSGAWEEARTALAAEVAGKTGLSAEFVRDQLAQRELVRQQAQHTHESLRILAAAAYTLAAGKPRAGKA